MAKSSCAAKYAVEKSVRKVTESAVLTAVAGKIAKIPWTGGRQTAGTEARWTGLLHEAVNVRMVGVGHGVAHNADRLMTPTVDDTVGSSYEPTEWWVFLFPASQGPEKHL